jgi:hypothetical protein
VTDGRRDDNHQEMLVAMRINPDYVLHLICKHAV